LGTYFILSLKSWQELNWPSIAISSERNFCEITSHVSIWYTSKQEIRANHIQILPCCAIWWIQMTGHLHWIVIDPSRSDNNCTRLILVSSPNRTLRNR
jgi:hypothetical protein